MFEVWLTANNAELEYIEQVMFASGALSVTLQDARDTPVFESTTGEKHTWPLTRVTGLFDDESNLRQLQVRLDAILGQVKTINYRTLKDQDWARLWMDQFKPMRFGNLLWVYPSWHNAPDPSAVNVLLDPGQAFGTGTHPSTALCLEWLDAKPPIGLELIDYGCGSGILAVAALKLGARHVQAVDIDTLALETTRENAQKNQIFEEMLDIVRPEEMETREVDIVMANILLKPLIELKTDITSHLKQGGKVVLSGILSDQSDVLVKAYENDFQLERSYRKDAWVLIEGVKV